MKTKKKLKELVIPRPKWLRGGTAGGNSGLLLDGKRCCLGFYCRLVGIGPKYIQGQGFPSDVPPEARNFKEEERLKEKLVGLVDAEGDDTQLCHDMVNTNDSEKISEAEREKRLTKHFKKLNTKVRFTGKKLPKVKPVG